MNDKLMKPFRAPRGSKGRAKPPVSESEEETALGVVSERCVIKETEEAIANKRGAYKVWESVGWQRNWRGMGGTGRQGGNGAEWSWLLDNGDGACAG